MEELGQPDTDEGKIPGAHVYKSTKEHRRWKGTEDVMVVKGLGHPMTIESIGHRRNLL